jgi:uncharacterized protein (TIGR03083 family)
MRDVGWHYECARKRIDTLVRPLPPSAWDRAVLTCPGWSVRDVVAHLLGVTEDGAAGRIVGIPTESLTAEQVERHRLETPVEMLDAWAVTAPFVAEAITQSERWPAAIDVLSHEHDLRGALGAAGARDHESIETIANLLGQGLHASTSVRVELGNEHVGAGASGTGDELTLRTTPFEFFRLRMGRRSRAQVRALQWSSDPSDVLDDLFIFGPAQQDVIE